jgi:hypothetical protein
MGGWILKRCRKCGHLGRHGEGRKFCKDCARYLCTHCNRQHDPRTVKGHAHVIYAEGQPPIGLY